MRAKLSNASGVSGGPGCESIGDRGRAGRSNGRHEGRGCRRGRGRGKLRAARRNVDRLAGIRALGSDLIRIRAVVRSVAAAAERQARLVDPGQDGRKRPQPKKQDQRDGKDAPHSPYRVEVSWHQNTN